MFKSLVTMAAVLSVAAPAMASKARMAALNNPASINDTYSIFDNPAKVYSVGDFATFEMGTTSNTSTGVNTPENVVTNGGTAAALYAPDSEGGFVKSFGDNKIGAYLGKKSAFTTRLRDTTGFAGQENPIEIIFASQAGDLKWGVAFNYSKSELKKDTATDDQQKQDAMGARVGVTGTNWDAGLIFGLGSNATGTADRTILTQNFTADADATYKGTTGFKLTGGYWFDNLYVYGSYYQDGAKVETDGAPGGTNLKTTIEQSQYEVGVLDHIKAEGMNFFYGVSYVGFTSKTSGTSATVGAIGTAVDNAYGKEQTHMPFIVGVEADAASWMVLRASAKQNFLLGETKPKTGDKTTISNNTTVAAGAGFKFNKFMLDTTLMSGSVPGAAGNGQINMDNLFANASLTYSF